MFRICKIFTFEAAHRLARAHSSECVDNIHGHSYKVKLSLIREELDGDEMVLDFGQLKEFIREIQEEWDHALFLPDSPWNKNDMLAGVSRKIITIFPNPTAESMAKYLYEELDRWLEKKIGPAVQVHSVKVHETETGWAEYWE